MAWLRTYGDVDKNKQLWAKGWRGEALYSGLGETWIKMLPPWTLMSPPSAHVIPVLDTWTACVKDDCLLPKIASICIYFFFFKKIW